LGECARYNPKYAGRKYKVVASGICPANQLILDLAECKHAHEKVFFPRGTVAHDKCEYASNELEAGNEYTIKESGGALDWTTVGSPDNEVGTTFTPYTSDLVVQLHDGGTATIECALGYTCAEKICKLNLAEGDDWKKNPVTSVTDSLLPHGCGFKIESHDQNTHFNSMLEETAEQHVLQKRTLVGIDSKDVSLTKIHVSRSKSSHLPLRSNIRGNRKATSLIETTVGSVECSVEKPCICLCTGSNC